MLGKVSLLQMCCAWFAILFSILKQKMRCVRFEDLTADVNEASNAPQQSHSASIPDLHIIYKSLIRHVVSFKVFLDRGNLRLQVRAL